MTFNCLGRLSRICFCLIRINEVEVKCLGTECGIAKLKITHLTPNAKYCLFYVHVFQKQKVTCLMTYFMRP